MALARAVALVWTYLWGHQSFWFYLLSMRCTAYTSLLYWDGFTKICLALLLGLTWEIGL